MASAPAQIQALPEASSPPLVGFSFSPWAVSWAAGETPTQALRTLLDRLSPDVVRLPVYWSEVEPSPGDFDFTTIDDLVQVVTDYDTTATRQTRILLVVGARNISYPELHLPGWVSQGAVRNLKTLYASREYTQYLTTSFEQFAPLPILFGWQIENEPLDNVVSDQSGSVAVPSAIVSSELKLLRKVDRVHPAVVTTFNSAHVSLDKRGSGPLAWLWNLLPGPKPAGHPARALQLGDALGLDIYVVTPSTPLSQDSAIERIGWKADTIDYWSQQSRASGRSLWITEMQAGPWAQTSGFTTTDLIVSADVYRDRGASLVLLWGVEGWLHSNQWMRAGLHAIHILRSTTDPVCRPAVGRPC
ncbi:MAG TPA: hypothetical protein VET65_09065 [Candidatus Limnocylindrales bacterium]|nr:hypothetical protein [Candidatus Limnocylindrales bacterium]